MDRERNFVEAVVVFSKKKKMEFSLYGNISFNSCNFSLLARGCRG